MKSILKKITNSKYANKPLDISRYKKKELISMLKKMLLIRFVENKLANEKKRGLIKGPIHLGAGQEAVAVGISKLLKKSDSIFGAHRSHSHILALDTNIQKFMSEILGKKNGLSLGRGGSMHLIDISNGFYGSTPIVAGTVSLAVGAAMASRLKKTNDIAISYFGDGACEEGVVHESLNLASIQKDPILFVVENNFFASHMHISERQSEVSTSRFAKANNIPHQIVDGNNVLEVYEVAKKMISQIRRGDGPGFIEAFTYRLYGHVDWRDDIDVGVNRSVKDLNTWKKKDPIKRLLNSMLNKKIIKLKEFDMMKSDLLHKISQAWDSAMKESYPKKKELLKNVY
jgi:TPP-dependent pyruvate/acetoin dehydrogenase alpha subunit